MSKQRRQQAIEKNQPMQIQWFTQDICGDYLEMLTDSPSGALLQGNVNMYLINLAQDIAAGNITWAEASYLFPFFPYFSDGTDSAVNFATGYSSTTSYSGNLAGIINFIHGQIQSGTLNFSELGNLYGGAPEPVGFNNIYSQLSVYRNILALYVMVTNPMFDFNPNAFPWSQWTSTNYYQEIQTVFLSSNTIWLNCSIYDEPDPGEPIIDYSVPYPYNGDPCDPAYSALIDPETGNYYTGSNFQQITDTFYSTIEQYGQVGATYFFPDLNDDGLITIEDLLDLLILMPITCPYELAPPPKITDSATIAKAPKVNKSNKGNIAKQTSPPAKSKHKGLEDLYTSGNQYTLPSGKIYVGAYHIHPTGGAMVGAKHTSAPHAKLTKLPPLKAQIPARSKGGKISKKQTTNQQTTRGSSNGY